jgi:rhodanese-related sulfurtransferase
MNEKIEIKDILAKSKLFGNLSQEALEAIAGSAHTMTAPQDMTLGKMGDTGKVCCIIVSGKVTLSRPGKAGGEYELGQLGPNDSFGESNLLSNEPFPATVKTVEETRLVIISRDQFDPILKKYPEVMKAVGKGFSLWLQRAGHIIESQTKLHHIESSRLKWIDFIPMVVLSLLLAFAYNASSPKGIPIFQKNFSDEAVPFIAPSEIYERYQQGKLLMVDAKPSIFYEQEHIKHAMNLPLSIFDFLFDMKLEKTDRSEEIIVYGRTISEHYDQKVAEKLVIRGFENVKILNGGLPAWKAKHYPVSP